MSPVCSSGGTLIKRKAARRSSSNHTINWRPWWICTHILCNYEWDSRALLSLLLVGLPELRERLSRRHQRSLYSRIHHRLHIDPTTADDTADYLRHRLRLGGAGDRELFSTDAIALLHESAGGLRDLDRLAEAALRDAWRRKKKLVEREAVVRVVAADR